MKSSLEREREREVEVKNNVRRVRQKRYFGQRQFAHPILVFALCIIFVSFYRRVVKFALSSLTKEQNLKQRENSLSGFFFVNFTYWLILS